MECHKWKKTTDVRVGAGSAAKWNRLPWKLVMDKFYPLVLTVHSDNDLVGLVQYTLDDLLSMDVDDKGFVEIISNIIDGSTLSGRVRFVNSLSL